LKKALRDDLKVGMVVPPWRVGSMISKVPWLANSPAAGHGQL
jgi:hypothetical protein